jgi:phosphoglycerate dehydrogenase-like enzyme
VSGGERRVVVITEITDLDPRAGVDLLAAAGFDVVVLPGEGLRAGMTPDDLPPRAADAVAAIVGFAPLGADELALFPALTLVCTTSTGTDMVDAAAAAARGIEVVGLGGVSTAEVAVHALTLMLAALREVPAGREVVSTGGWTTELTATPPEIGALTLGLVGFGRIAQETARIARPLFDRILAFDPYVAEPAHGVELASLDDVLTRADVVSLHVPATAETTGMISADRLRALRPGAVLVNVSRGELVDAAAVRAALDAGLLRAYAADVLDGEPPALDDPLRTHPRAIVTPHMAFLSDASRLRYERGPAERIVARLG